MHLIFCLISHFIMIYGKFTVVSFAEVCPLNDIKLMNGCNRIPDDTFSALEHLSRCEHKKKKGNESFWVEKHMHSHGAQNVTEKGHNEIRK